MPVPVPMPMPVEGMVPDLLHIIPVEFRAGWDKSDLISDVEVLPTNHYALLTGWTHLGWEILEDSPMRLVE